MREAILPITLSEFNISKDDLVKMLEFRLKRLNRIETLRFCAHINLFIANPDHPRQSLSQQLPFLKMFLTDRDLKIIKPHTQPMTNKDGYRAERAFFHREQMLELMRYVSVHCPDSAKYNNLTQNNRSKRMFWEATLIVSDLLLDKIYSKVNLNEPTDTRRKSFLEPIRHSARYGSKAMDPIRAFGRGARIFFECLPHKCPEFISTFEKTTKLSLNEYFAFLFFVVGHFWKIPVEQESHRRHFISMNTFSQYPDLDTAFKRYIELESQTADNMARSLRADPCSLENKFRTLRQKPILRLDDTNAIVLDPAFYIEKATTGPLFAIPEQIGHLLTSFGFAFEKYVQNILQIMYPEPDNTQCRLITNQELGSKRKRQGELDACLIDGKNLLLFEVKARWIKDDKIVEPNYEDYLHELRNKYGEGAKQLAKAITSLISGQGAIEGHDIKNIQRIYPILIVLDSSLGLLGNTWFFELEFSKELESDGLLPGTNRIMTKLDREIAPLTLMPIDVLEDLEASVRNFSLTNLLRDYFLFRDENMPEEVDTLSLAEFIGLSKYAEKIVTQGGSVTSSYLKISNESARILKVL